MRMALQVSEDPTLVMQTVTDKTEGGGTGESIGKEYVDEQDKKVLLTAKGYADGGDTETLTAAKEYADVALGNVAALLETI